MAVVRTLQKTGDVRHHEDEGLRSRRGTTPRLVGLARVASVAEPGSSSRPVQAPRSTSTRARIERARIREARSRGRQDKAEWTRAGWARSSIDTVRKSA